MNITESLFRLQDVDYKAFYSKLIPSINPNTILGVRTPILKGIAKDIKNDCCDFLDMLPHVYYEENNVLFRIIYRRTSQRTHGT